MSARSGGYRLLVLALLLVLPACGQQGHAAPPASTTGALGSNGMQSNPHHGVFTPTPSGSPYSLPYTWKNAASGSLQMGNPSAYQFAPTNSRIGYACSTGSPAFYVTDDGGSAWSGPVAPPFGSCDGVFLPDLVAQDVFVAQPVPYPLNSAQSEDQLWRSRDGGASWQKLGMVRGVQEPLGWSNLAMVDGRLIGSVQIDGEGYIQNDLYVSDDGGLTWQPLAANVASEGYTLDQFVATDSVIFISGAQGVGSAGLSAMEPAARAQSPLTRPAVPASTLPRLSANRSAPGPVFWRSLDAGATWTQISLPGGLPLVVRSSGNTGYYALSSVSQQTGNVNGSPIYDTTYWWAMDIGSGAPSWKQLPDLAGIEHGYVIAGSATSALAPDGTVFVAAQHDAQSYGDDAGVFLIYPGDPSPAWQPVVAGRVQYWQAVVTPMGLRLWGVGAFAGDQGLKYVDIGHQVT